MKIFQGNLLLCILAENRKPTLIKYNLNTDEFQLSDIDLPGSMACIGFTNSKLIFCGIDSENEQLRLSVFNF